MRLLVRLLLVAVVIALLLPLPAVTDRSAAASEAAGVVISGVSPGEEGISLTNTGQNDADLKGLSVTDGEGTLTFVRSLVLGPGDTVHLVKQKGAGWYTSRDPCVEFGSDTFQRRGSLVLANSGDEAVLMRGEKVLDAVCYGTSKGASGWEGEPVPCPSGCYLVRVSSGSSAASWRALEPGWTGLSYGDAFVCDVEPFSFPESGGEPVYRAISSAERSVDVSIYLLSCPNVVALLCELEERGVDVRVLLEGSPLGTDVTREMELMKTLCDRGGEVRLINPPGTDGGRYTYAHAKYAVVDSETTVVTSENWTSGNMGYGLGNRGWGAVVRGEGLAGYMESVFESDFSTGWGDVLPLTEAYPSQRAYGFPLEYEAPETEETTSYSCMVRPVLSPDDSLDAMRALMASASERLYAEEMGLGSSMSSAREDTPIAWMGEAVSRGADVRLILDSTSDDVTETATRISASTGMKAVARSGGTEFSMIHNKGVVADGTVWVGSVNWTSTSFERNREAALVIESADVADFFAGLFLEDFGVDVLDVEETGVSMTAEVVRSGGGHKLVLRAVAPAGYELEWSSGDGKVRTTSESVCVFDVGPGEHVASVSVVGTEARGEAAYSVPEEEKGFSVVYLVAAAVVLVGFVASVFRGKAEGHRGCGNEYERQCYDKRQRTVYFNSG